MMAIITLLVTMGPMVIISAIIEIATRIPDRIREHREMKIFRRTHSIFNNKSAY